MSLLKLLTVYPVLIAVALAWQYIITTDKQVVPRNENYIAGCNYVVNNFMIDCKIKWQHAFHIT